MIILVQLQNIIYSAEFYEPLSQYQLEQKYDVITKTFKVKDDVPRQRFIKDVNNDGKADIISQSESEVGIWVQLSQDYTFSEKKQWTEEFDKSIGWGDTNIHPIFIEDIDGDGYYDIIGFSYKYVQILFSDGQSFYNKYGKINYIEDYGKSNGYPDQETMLRLVGDVTGDGKADIVSFTSDGVFVSISKGNDFEIKSLWVSYYTWVSFTYNPRFLVDIDGDGINDIIGFGNTDIYVNFSTGNSFLTGQILSSEFPKSVFLDQFRFPRILQDINGDGKADIIAFGQSRIWVSLSDGRNQFKPKFSITQDAKFTVDDLWGKVHLRYVEDINGDGIQDCIGFSSYGVRVSYGVQECSDITRQPKNQCICQGEYYEDGVSQCLRIPDNCGQFFHMFNDNDNLYLFMNGEKIPMIPTSTTKRQEGIWFILIDAHNGQIKEINNFDIEQDSQEIQNLNQFINNNNNFNQNILIIANYGQITTQYENKLPFTYKQSEINTFMYNSLCLFDCNVQCDTCINGTNNCITCAKNRQNPPSCICIEGYYEIPMVKECIQISQKCAILLTAVSFGGYNTIKGKNYGNYINQLRNTKIEPEKGFNFTLVNNNGQIQEEKIFDTLWTTQAVDDIINFINGLNRGQIVMGISVIDASRYLYQKGWDALEMLGVQKPDNYQYLSAFSFIGKKGVQVGSIPQQYKHIQNPGSVIAISQQCLQDMLILKECSYRCSTCNQAINKCNECSHLTRENPPNCDCKIGFYDKQIPECILIKCSLCQQIFNNNDCQDSSYNCQLYKRFCQEKYAIQLNNNNKFQCKNVNIYKLSCLECQELIKDYNCNKQKDKNICKSQQQFCYSTFQNKLLNIDFQIMDGEIFQCECNQIQPFCLECSSNKEYCLKCDQSQKKKIQQGKCVEDLALKECDNIPEYCTKCNPNTKKCEMCDKTLNRVIVDSKCECDYLYDNTDKNNIGLCIQVQNMVTSTVSSTKSVTTAQSSISVALIVANPSIFLQMLDSLQVLLYTLYLNVEYPSIVLQQFESFETFTFSFIPTFGKSNQHYQQPPKSLEKLGFTTQNQEYL